ncbi:MAG: YceI family protein [Acidobacteriota bacterium]
MRRICLTVVGLFMLLAAGAEPAQAITYKIDPVHSSVGFRIRHLVGKVRGSFLSFSGTITMDPSHPSDGAVTVTIQANSIDTGNEDRDRHLKSAEFFEAEEYPTIQFESTAVRGSGENLKVDGLLTMHGVSRPVTLDVEFLGVVDDPWGNIRAGFEAHTTLQRKEFGISWNKALDAGGLILGEEVEINIVLEAIRPKTKPEKESSPQETGSERP